MSVIGRKWALNANFKWRSFKITEEGDFDKNVFKLTKRNRLINLTESKKNWEWKFKFEEILLG
jgi:hypothetical protein